MTQNTIKIKRLRDGARMPFRASEAAAASDLFACLDAPVTLAPGERAQIPAGIAIELPRNDLVALVFSRSGQGVKHGVTLCNSVGVVDADYRGEITVGLINHGDKPYEVRDGDRIAQLMITSCFAFPFEEAKELGETARGAGGFGSTGV